VTPNEFIAKWKNADLKERAGSQEQFIDLCRLLGEPTPAEADPKGDWYAFEKGALKTGGGDGWADVWKRGCFAWEYKGKGKNLDAAFAQLQRYAIALENPPLLIVSDMEVFRIHTNWTNTVQDVIEIPLEELADDRRRRVLKWAFSETDVEQLKPSKTRQELTEQVAAGFAQLAQRLRDRGHDPEVVAHFVNRLVFCMFAEDVDLLPNHMFKRMLEAGLRQPAEFEVHAQKLFAAMKSGGPVGFERVEWFNGGLFDDDKTLPLTEDDIKQTLEVARLDWSNIDPSIMGTLFERGLDPDKRSQLGAHYTDRDKIMLIVNPVIVEPLTHEWDAVRAKIEALMERHRTHKSKGEKTKAYNEAQSLHRAFLDRLKDFRVLDPACGSGNFLYLSLIELKNLEHRVNLDAEMLGLPREFPGVGPQCVKGIEINPFAAELARISAWIGEIQWMKRNGFDAARNPILKPLETIECRDALLNADGTESDWPKADVVVGNPPFLGAKEFLATLEETYVSKLREVYEDRLPGGANLVLYWFEKAFEGIASNLWRFGLVGTNAIRYGISNGVLQRILESSHPFNAWADEPWVVEGAAVRVSILCVEPQEQTTPAMLNGLSVRGISARLQEVSSDKTVDFLQCAPLEECQRVAFVGSQKDGPFNVDPKLAREMLSAPRNPHGKSNADVVRCWLNGRAILEARSDLWIIDFGERKLEEAMLYEVPFCYVQKKVEPLRRTNRDKRRREKWWLHGRPGTAAKAVLSKLDCYIATPLTAKHRVFRYYPIEQFPDNSVVVIARDDPVMFGLLHSRQHRLWFLFSCSFLGVGNDPRYTPTTCFETFPFPQGLTPNIPAADYADDPRAIAIAEAAKKLNELREAWLNPEDLVERVPEVVPGYPDRIVPKDDKAAAILKKRTLTNLYNERPAWLDHAHRALDEAVAAAYGWPADLSDEEILERLFKLNQERAAAEGGTAETQLV
jgi:type II restriction/modification system DNA methylase subunit YeeA